MESGLAGCLQEERKKADSKWMQSMAWIWSWDAVGDPAGLLLLLLHQFGIPEGVRLLPGVESLGIRRQQ